MNDGAELIMRIEKIQGKYKIGETIRVVVNDSKEIIKRLKKGYMIVGYDPNLLYFSNTEDLWTTK